MSRISYLEEKLRQLKDSENFFIELEEKEDLSSFNNGDDDTPNVIELTEEATEEDKEIIYNFNLVMIENWESRKLQAQFKEEYDAVSLYITYEDFLKAKVKEAKFSKNLDFRRIYLLTKAIDSEISRKRLEALFPSQAT